MTTCNMEQCRINATITTTREVAKTNFALGHSKYVFNISAAESHSQQLLHRVSAGAFEISISPTPVVHVGVPPSANSAAQQFAMPHQINLPG